MTNGKLCLTLQFLSPLALVLHTNVAGPWGAAKTAPLSRGGWQHGVKVKLIPLLLHREAAIPALLLRAFLSFPECEDNHQELHCLWRTAEPADSSGRSQLHTLSPNSLLSPSVGLWQAISSADWIL